MHATRLGGVGDLRVEAVGAELIIMEDSGHTGSTTMTDQMHAAAEGARRS